MDGWMANGVWTKMQEVRNIFAIFDEDGSGSIDTAEMKNLFEGTSALTH